MADAFRRSLVLLITLALSGGIFVAASRLLAPERKGIVSMIKSPPGAGENQVPEPFTPAEPAGVIPGLTALSQEYADLMDRVQPGVVSINTKTTVETERPINAFFNANVEVQKPGLGSGVIVSKEGHVLTNQHVVDGVDEVRITTHSGRSYDCMLIGYRVESDIAVLKITTENGEEFPALPFGNSDSVRVGEIVFAIGNPFGLGETVTQGIISALPRPLSDADFKTFQTDTVINQGNSGGPMVNTNGEIIGISTAIYTHGADQTYAGVSLAIPSNDARKSFEGIMAKGKPDTGYLGIQALDLKNYRSGGVQIDYVTPGSPAEKAGLKKGDIVVNFAGRSVRSSAEFYRLIAQTTIGKRVPIKVINEGATTVLQATIISLEAFYDAPPPEESDEAVARISDALGIKVQNLSMMHRRRLNIRAGSPGILITAVEPDSRVAAELRAGYILYALNDNPIRTAKQFYSLINSLPFGEEAKLFYYRYGGYKGVVRFVPNQR